MEKIELCTGVTVTTTGDEHDTTCNGAVTVGTGSSTFDIASVTAGQQVGTFVSVMWCYMSRGVTIVCAMCW